MYIAGAIFGGHIGWAARFGCTYPTHPTATRRTIRFMLSLSVHALLNLKGKFRPKFGRTGPDTFLNTLCNGTSATASLKSLWTSVSEVECVRKSCHGAAP